MATENNSRPVTRSTMPQIIFGALIGILLGIAGVLIYQGYLGQITNILLYVSLVFFGVVVLTFILVWGFKTYLTRLIFDSKVADSPDLIAEAQQMTDQLSSSVIDKLMVGVDEEDKKKVKGLVARLGNWFLWGRLRNWWWSWILGIFVSLGGLTGTLLLVNQNELLQNQNNLVANQTELMTRQNKLIENQMSLEEASRRGSLVVLMSNIFDKVDDEIAEQRVEMRRKGQVVTDSSKYSLSQSLIGQIAALSQAFKPYRYMDGDTLIGRPLSPERGQLLLTITRLPLEMETLVKIFTQSVFRGADLREAKFAGAFLRGSDLQGAYLMRADLREANLSNADLRGADLREADLRKTDLVDANLREANLSRAYLIGADLKRCDLIEINLNGAYLSGADFNRAYLMKANLQWADLSEADLSGVDLSRAQLLGASLIDAQLVGAQLDRADLVGAHLDRADLRWAHLVGTHFSGADLRETNLKEADLREADLTRALNLNEEQIVIVASLFRCKLPKNVDMAKLKKEHPALFKKPEE